MKNLLALIVTAIALIGCSGGEGGGGGDKDRDKPDDPIIDPCAGPVPCLNTDWEDQFAVFYDAQGVPYVLGSIGDIAAVAGYWTKEGDRALIAFKINQPKCYTGSITYGEIDADEDGHTDLILSGVSGQVEICDETLNIFDVICNEYSSSPFYDIEAYYDGMAYLSGKELNTEMPIGTSEVNDVKIRIELIKELLEE